MTNLSPATLHMFTNALTHYEPGITKMIEELCGVKRNKNLKDWFYQDKKEENEWFVFDAVYIHYSYFADCRRTEKCNCYFCNYHHYNRIKNMKAIKDEITKCVVSTGIAPKLAVYNMTTSPILRKYNIVEIVGPTEKLYTKPRKKPTKCIVIEHSLTIYEICYSVTNTKTKKNKNKKYFIIKPPPPLPHSKV